MFGANLTGSVVLVVEVQWTYRHIVITVLQLWGTQKWIFPTKAQDLFFYEHLYYSLLNYICEKVEQTNTS